MKKYKVNVGVLYHPSGTYMRGSEVELSDEEAVLLGPKRVTLHDAKKAEKAWKEAEKAKKKGEK